MVTTGETFGHYRIEEKLGGGTFGTVFRAHDIRLDREVAVKILHHQDCEDETELGRVLQEGRAASALNHPNICAIYDAGEEEGLHYIAMEYVEGWTLAELVEGGPLAVAKALDYVTQMAGALAHAHSRGIIHRDLKASNVVITADNQAKLLDFGLARRLDAQQLEVATESRQSIAEIGGLAGTLAYMAPEVLRGKPASASSDLWSLGALLYQMLSGSLPFKGGTPFELSLAIMVEAPPPLPPEVPRAVCTIVDRCLEKEPEKRYRSDEELARRLEAARAELEGGGERSPLLRRSRVLVAGAVLMAVLAAAVGWKWHARKAASTTPPAVTVVQPTTARPATPQNLPVTPPAASPTSPSPKPARQYPGKPEILVWVNTKTGIYHCPGSRWYKNTADGALMPQRQAQQRGYRPSASKPCE
jgi:eukaryotic-like serine/threonine-protein kinase